MKQIRFSLSQIVRFVGTGVMLVFIYRETGPVTTLFAFFMAVQAELNSVLIKLLIKKGQ